MSNIVANLAEVELPVFTAAIFTAIAALWRASRTARKEQRDRDTAIQSKVNSILERISVNREVNIELRRDVDLLKRTVPQLSETVAVLAAEFENHERWHERRTGNAVQG